MNYKPSLWLLALTTALISCQKEPDWAEQSNEYLVYTQKDASFEAGRYENYFIADSILLIDDAEEPKYLKGTEAEKIISRVALNMERAGYHRTDRKEEADLGLQLSYIFDTHYLSAIRTLRIGGGDTPAIGILITGAATGWAGTTVSPSATAIRKTPCWERWST